MTWKTKNLLLLVLLTSLLSSFGVNAQQDQCQLASWGDLEYRLALDGMLAAGCFDPETNHSPLAMEVNSLLQDGTDDARGRVQLALEAVRIYLEKQFENPETPQIQNAGELLVAMAGLKKSIEENPETPEPSIKTKWKPGKLDMLPEALERLDFSAALGGDD
jgi:hypothetical protein